MVSIRKTSDVYFFTATNFKWIKLLENDEHKNIVIGSLQFSAIAGEITPAMAEN